MFVIKRQNVTHATRIMQINYFVRIFCIDMIGRTIPEERVSKWNFEGLANEDRTKKRSIDI